MGKQRKKLLLHWGIGLGAVALLVLVGESVGIGIPCPVYHFTGLYCPGCGSMRALRALARLDFAAAWRYNPAFVLLLPVLAALLAVDTLRTLRGGEQRQRRWQLVLSLSLCAGLLAFGVLRNLPAFHMLAPG